MIARLADRPGSLGAAVADPEQPLPEGFRVVLEHDTLRPAADRLFGGSPQRGLRLSAAGRTALAELDAGPIRSRSAGLLARRLTDADLAYPRPPLPAAHPDITVLVPSYGRTEVLVRCLDALGRAYPVVVVDDGSPDPAAVAAVAAEHGARLVRRVCNGGPGAARNSGLEHVHTEFVAFLDSDCEPPLGWVESLTAHLADPLVAVAAPRIVALPGATAVGRYAAARGSLDLGPRASRVAPGHRVPYVPTAALVVRTSAIRDLAGFDPALRVGEDVDLIWRLHRAGWRVRYDPTVEVGHREPQTWSALLRRRYRYGTSAGALARRHPEAIAPFALNPWAFTAVTGALTRRPSLVAAGLLLLGARSGPSLHRAGLNPSTIAAQLAEGVGKTWLGAGRYATQFLAPALATALLAPGGRRRGRRLGVAALVLSGPLAVWRSRRPALDPARYVAASIADDIAYGSGVWVGSVRARTTAAIRPTLTHRPARAATAFLRRFTHPQRGGQT